MRPPSLLRLAVVALGALLLHLFPWSQPFVDAIRRGDALYADLARAAAVEAYHQAAALDPRSPLALLRVGRVYLSWFRWPEAGEAFRAANRRRPTAEGWLGLGESLAGRGDWAAATRAWLRAGQLSPGNPAVYINLGRAFLAQNHWDQAEEQLEKALALGLDAPLAHAWLGFLRLDDPAAARPHLEQVGDPALLAWLDQIEAEHDPARRAVLAANLLLHQELPTLARRQLETALAARPNDAAAQATLGYTLDRLGETGAGHAALLRAVELDPDLPLVYFFLGLHERDLGRWQAAQAYFWEVLQREPGHAAACAEMAAAYAALHDYAGAEEWYAAAVERAGGEEEISFRLLQVSFYLDHAYRVETNGLLAAQEAVGVAPNDARAHDLLGWALHLTGQPAAAEATLLHALTLDPHLASAHLHLGSLYAHIGRPTLARQYLGRAIDLDTAGGIRERAQVTLAGLGP